MEFSSIENNSTKIEFAEGKRRIVEKSGKWVAHNIVVPDGYTISPDVAGDHFRLRRFLQLVADCQPKPFNDLRVIDFGCHEGLYAIEFGRQGAEVVGVEGRQVHLDKADFIKRHLGLNKVSFHCEDVRNFNRDRFGSFDVALCTGILYHLGLSDGMHFLEEICNASNMVIVDTHIGLLPEHAVLYKDKQYWGHEYKEPSVKEDELSDVLINNGASMGNSTSFWLTRGSLFNALSDFGCTSVFEVGAPCIGGQFFDRVTVVGIKGRPVNVMSAPAYFASIEARHGAIPCLDTAGQELPRY